jgi:hypothetical protein
MSRTGSASGEAEARTSSRQQERGEKNRVSGRQATELHRELRRTEQTAKKQRMELVKLEQARERVGHERLCGVWEGCTVMWVSFSRQKEFCRGL